MYLNTQSLLPHITQIRQLLKEEKPELLLLSETRITDEIEDFEIACSNYVCLRCDSMSRYTGGVVIYIREDIKHTVICNRTYNENLWILSIKVKQKMVNTMFTVLYHSPSKSTADFINHFDTWCEEVVQLEIINYICGDFNIDLIKDSFYKEKIIKICTDRGLKQHIKDPTRITGNSRTLIDYVLSNDKTEAVVLTTEKISDHSIIIFGSKECIPEQTKKLTKIQKLVGYKAEGFQENLEKYNWNLDSYVNISERVSIFEQKLVESLAKFIRSVKKTNLKDNEWYNRQLFEMKRERDKAYMVASYEPYKENWKKYTTKRNTYVRELHKAEK